MDLKKANNSPRFGATDDVNEKEGEKRNNKDVPNSEGSTARPK